MIFLFSLQAFADSIRDELADFAEQGVGDDVVLLFSAHSLPMSVCFVGHLLLHGISS